MSQTGLAGDAETGRGRAGERREQRLGPNLDVGGRAARGSQGQRAGELVDLVARARLWVAAEEGGGQGGLGDCKMGGGHRGVRWGGVFGAGQCACRGGCRSVTGMDELTGSFRVVQTMWSLGWYQNWTSALSCSFPARGSDWRVILQLRQNGEQTGCVVSSAHVLVLPFFLQLQLVGTSASVRRS